MDPGVSVDDRAVHPDAMIVARTLSSAGPGPRQSIPRTRLHPPQVRALCRERLLKALATGFDHRLILVTGPAGCGKTTLLAQFVARHEGGTAWYRADVDDAADEKVLLAHLAQALTPVVPGLDGQWPTVEAASDALAAVRSRLADEIGRVLLAIDDLHVIVGTAAEQALGVLVDAFPSWLHLAATCRQPPNWNLSRQRVSGALFEVGPDDLRFRSWEVERLFCDVYGEPLPPGDLAQLTRGLEGWAAGLQLFHLATREKPPGERRRAVASLPARSKLIREYLTGNVLDELPDEERGFVVDTSVVGRLSPGLCDELRGRTDSRRMLDGLEARQAFVIRLEDDGTYRYHEVFRSYLENRLIERDGEEGARAWALRAAGLLEAEGSMADALRAYCRAGDWASVQRVLEKGGAALADDPGAWLDALPPALLDGDPWVMLATARRAVATGRFVTALEIYERAAHLFTTVGAETVCRRERAALAVWLDPSAPMPPDWVGRLRTAVCGRPTTTLSGGMPIICESAGAERLATGLISLLSGEVGRAARVLVTLVDDPDVGLVTAAAARVALTVAQALATGSARDVEEGGELFELVELAETPWLAWMARAASGLRGDADGWAQASAVADALGAQGDEWGGVLATLFGVLGAVFTGGSPVEELTALAARLRRLDAPVLEVWVRAWLATALARAGRPEAGEVARDAAALAARLGVPGARVWALTVQAQLLPESRAGELVAAAEAVRRERGADISVPLVLGPADRVGGWVGGHATADELLTDRRHAGDLRGQSSSPDAPSADAVVRVRCLGGFRLEIGARLVDLTDVRPRARSVLRYLAAEVGRPTHAETLVAALWPDVDRAAGKHNLQVALSSLRKVLYGYPPYGGRLLHREGSSYVLVVPDGSDDDLITFSAALSEARQRACDGDSTAAVAAGQRALAAYGGDLLPEEGPADWVVERRRTLGIEAAEAASLVAEQALQIGRADAAVAACVQGLDADRYNDGLWRLLAAAHAACGDLAAVARTNDRYHAMLVELGVTMP
jgi:DNA-binding SARP family transcriptional activator